MRSSLQGMVSLGIAMLVVFGSPSRLPRLSPDKEEVNIEKYAIKRVFPAYPPSAQQYHIEGVVTILVTVGADGKTSKAEFVRGHNIFRSVSLDAAKRWQFKLPDNTFEGTIHFVFKLKE